MNITKIKKAKNIKKLTMITAYDALFAKLFEKEVDMILVGDSLNMSFAGKADTLSATLEQMIYHTNAVCAGAPKAFVILDMPFGTYINKNEALKNAVEVYRQTKAAAIKIEGGADRADIIEHLTSNSIAVMGHIGLMPQYVRSEGGYIPYILRGTHEVTGLVWFPIWLLMSIIAFKDVNGSTGLASGLHSFQTAYAII